MMDRRNFLAGMLSAAAAPAFVRVGSLMRVKPMVTPRLWDGLVSAYDPLGHAKVGSMPDTIIFTDVGDYPVDFVALIVQQYQERFDEMLRREAASPDGWLVTGEGCRHD